MREIVFDTETTGFDPATGDRVVEIGCVEMVNQVITGETFHVYINPERDMPQSAFEVHGLSEEFLSDKPKFAEIAQSFVDFVGEDSLLVAHNASFDMKFVNAELRLLSMPAYGNDRVVDTLMIARRKHPMGPNSLDALCSRYGIDNSKREKHGALLDAELLADVYVELSGGKQRGLDFDAENGASRIGMTKKRAPAKTRAKPLPSRLTDDERQAHRAFISTLGDDTLWHQLWDKEKAGS
ncbi:MAG: DNA polymerase III subunit epsilon [Pseudomonadota bacterium]